MKMKKVLITLAAVSAISTTLFAEFEPIKMKIGKLTVEPNIFVSMQYDDNIFLSKDNPQHDLRYRIKPALDFIYGNKNDDYIDLQFAYEWEFYNDLSDQNDENWYLNAGVFWDFTKSTIFLKADYSTDTNGDLEQGTLTRETSSSLSSEFERTISGKTSASLMFDVKYKDYPNNAYLIGYTDLNPAARFYYQMFPKSDIFGEFGYGYVKRTGYNGSDDQYTTYSIGVRREHTAKLDLEGKIGGQYRSPKEKGTDDTFNIIFYLKMLARFSKLTTMTVHGGQYITPAANNANADKTELWAEAMLVRKLSRCELYFDARAKFRHFEWNDVKIDDVYRKDDEWTFYVGSYYRITPELKAGISYQFRTDDSNNDNYDFDDNQITIYGRYNL